MHLLNVQSNQFGPLEITFDVGSVPETGCVIRLFLVIVNDDMSGFENMTQLFLGIGMKIIFQSITDNTFNSENQWCWSCQYEWCCNFLVLMVINSMRHRDACSILPKDAHGFVLLCFDLVWLFFMELHDVFTSILLGCFTELWASNCFVKSNPEWYNFYIKVMFQ